MALEFVPFIPAENLSHVTKVRVPQWHDNMLLSFALCLRIMHDLEYYLSKYSIYLNNDSLATSTVGMINFYGWLKSGAQLNYFFTIPTKLPVAVGSFNTKDK